MQIKNVDQFFRSNINQKGGNVQKRHRIWEMPKRNNEKRRKRAIFNKKYSYIAHFPIRVAATRV